MGDESDLGHASPSDLGTAETRDHVLSAVTDVLLRLDEDGTVRTCVDDPPSTLGYAPEDLAGEPVASLFASEAARTPLYDVYSADRFREAVLEAGADTVTVPLEPSDGAPVALSLRTVSLPDTTDVVCVGRDVSGRDPRAGTDRSEVDLLDDVADPIYALDAEGRIEYVNDALVEYTGYDAADLHGRDMAELIPVTADVPGLADQFDLADATEQPSRTVETTVVTSDGERILTEANVTALVADGTYAGSLGVLRDIRERKHREQNLDLLKQILTRVFRHNVRNELSIVKGHAGFLDEQLDDDLGNHAKKILETANRLLSHSEKARLIERVVDTDDRYALDVTDQVTAAVERVREEYPDARIDVDVPSEAVVEAHPEIDIAIEELLENAIVHAPDETTPRVDLWLERREETTTLFVEDESGGLADHELTVLERGTESKLEHGSGVGLWLIRWLVEYSDAEMIAHRTDEGSLMGVRFAQQASEDATRNGPTASPLVRTPAAVRDDSLESFRGDPVVGRVDALAELEELYDSLEATGGHAVLLTGEAGIGKTTLVEQFRDRLADRSDEPLIATGFCAADVQPSYHAFRQVLDDLPNDRDSTEILDDAASLSVTDASELQRRKRTLFADIAEYVRDVAADRPVVLLVEDMQWADQGTIDLFEYLVEEVGRWGHPVMFLGTYRTSGVERTHPVMEVAAETIEAGRGTVIELDPFDLEEVRSLVAHTLDVEGLPASFVEAVHDHTGGTPLFVTELVRHLADTLGPIRTVEDLPERLDAVDVPESVESAVAERLDALPETVQPVLRLGAVIGTEFSLDLLREASDRSVDELVARTDTLTRRQVWRRSADGLEFVHGVIREQTLDAVPDAERERLHADVAAAIETVHADSLDEYAGRLGYHYEQIGEYETALEYYRQAGAYEADRYAQRDAIDHYERALSLAEDHGVGDASVVGAVYTDLGEVFELLGEWDRARECYEESLDRARAQDDVKREAQTLHDLGKVAETYGDSDRAVEYFEDSLEKARACGAGEIQAESLLRIGASLTSRGGFDEARVYFERSLAKAKEVGDARLEAGSLLNLGINTQQRGEYERAREYLEESLAIFREIGRRRGEANTLLFLGNIASDRGRYERAREYHEESLAICREIGDRGIEKNCLNNLGNVARNRGHYERARTYYQQSLDIAEEVGNRQSQAGTLVNLGVIASYRGDYERARQRYEESLAIYEEIGDSQGQAYALDNLGDVAATRGNYEEARGYYEESLAISEEIGDRRSEAVVRNNLGAVARNRGEFDSAYEYSDQARAVAEETGYRQVEGSTLRQLGRTANERGDLERAEEHLRAALDVARAIDGKDLLVGTLRELGAVARRQERYERAAEYVAEALEACDEDEHVLDRGNAHLERARLALVRDDVETAREAVERAARRFADLDAKHQAARADVVRGRVAAATGAPAAAREHWRDALDTFEAVGAPHDALEALRRLAETCRRVGDDDRAEEYRARARTLLETAPDAVRARHEEWIGIEG